MHPSPKQVQAAPNFLFFATAVVFFCTHLGGSWRNSSQIAIIGKELHKTLAGMFFTVVLFSLRLAHPTGVVEAALLIFLGSCGPRFGPEKVC